jgi:hypothetical protein
MKPTDQMQVRKDIIKMTILYPNGEGKKFDMDYYSTKHMPMIACFERNRRGPAESNRIANQRFTPYVPRKTGKQRYAGDSLAKSFKFT